MTATASKFANAILKTGKTWSSLDKTARFKLWDKNFVIKRRGKRRGEPDWSEPDRLNLFGQIPAKVRNNPTKLERFMGNINLGHIVPHKEGGPTELYNVVWQTAGSNKSLGAYKITPCLLKHIKAEETYFAKHHHWSPALLEAHRQCIKMYKAQVKKGLEDEAETDEALSEYENFYDDISQLDSINQIYDSVYDGIYDNQYQLQQPGHNNLYLNHGYANQQHQSYEYILLILVFVLVALCVSLLSCLVCFIMGHCTSNITSKFNKLHKNGHYDTQQLSNDSMV